jgi:exopolysaccharide production protein ExoY
LPETYLPSGISPSNRAPRGSTGRRLPEMAERVAGGVLMTVASPVIIASALVVSLLSRRAPFVAHLRVGRGNKPFWMLKLRTMWDRDAAYLRGEGWVEHIEAEPDDGHKDPSDPRVTSRFAAFCRRHSIDEFPQFWHVARGEMSLVGPRPLTRTEVMRYYGPHATELLSVKPGITGLWQVRGRSAIRFPERAALDLELVRTLTLGKYLRILVRTLPALIRGDGAW